jgi:peptidoglycan/LPS O-acetylase OafA/YrhL
MDQPEASKNVSAVRLHYVDWLRVLAMLMVFAFHAVHPYDRMGWHIKNSELSMPLTVAMAYVATWGMPFFFLLAGASNWFSLLRRTPRSFVSERFRRLFVPYVIAALIFTPIQLYVEWSHKTQTGVWQMTLAERIGLLTPSLSSQIFGQYGYHLWFLGFLFAFALLTLPLFGWLRSEGGVKWLARAAVRMEHRGALLLVIVPLAAIRLSLQPFFPGEHDWAEFFFLLAFFLLGYLLFAEQRLLRAVRRDGWLYVVVGLAATLVAAVMVSSVESIATETAPRTLFDVVLWVLITVNAWCWSLFGLYLGMRFLDFRNQWVDHGQEAVLPIYVIHQPIIIVIAYFVVQWDASLPVKLVVTIVSSFGVAFGLYEVLIRPFASMRAVFGMKPRRPTVHEGHTPTPGRVGVA